MKLMRELTCLLVCLWAFFAAMLFWLVSKDACLRLLNKADLLRHRSALQFATLSVFVCGMWFYAASKGDRGQINDCGLENESARVVVRTGGGDTPRSISTPVLPDAADVGDAEGFGDMPIVSNLNVCAIARGTNFTELVFGWTALTRPINDLAWIYTGTNLPIFEKTLPIDVSGCVSNALVSIYDSDIAGTNAIDKAFYSVGDETDSDGDGASDADERLVYHSNPANQDTDGDKIPDGEEIALGISPLLADTDGDGLSDDTEVGSVYSDLGPIWPSSGDFSDITHLVATSAYNTVIIPLQTPFQRGGETVTNVLVSAKGVVMLNAKALDIANAYFVPFDFSSPLNTGAFTVAPLSDAGLFLKSNSTVKVGVTSTSIPESYCVKVENLGRQGDGVDTNNVSFAVAFPFIRSNDVFIIYRNVVGEEMDGRNAGVGYQTFRSRRRKSLAYMKPSFVTNYKVLMLDTGTNTDPTSADTDGDGLSDGEEFALGLSPMFADSDRDGLPDDWEIANGLDPQSASGDDGASGDSDNDGLSNFDEYCNGTDPSSPDTDNGGASDGAEVAAGTDPNDDSDDASSPVASQYRELIFNINGDYAAWEMTITGLGPDDTRVRTISMGAPDSANTTTLRVQKGNAYRLRMRWLNCDNHDDDKCCPWYCWEAQIDGLPTARTYNNNSAVRLGGNEIVAGDGWIAENSDGLLTSHVHQSTYDYDGNPCPGNVAKNLEATLYVYNCNVSICDPYDENWVPLVPSRVVLADEKLRIKVEIEPQISTLAECVSKLGADIAVVTGSTAPQGVKVPISNHGILDNSEPGVSVLKLELERSLLRQLGILPSQESDSLDEMSVYDVGSIAGINGSDLSDSDQFANLGFVWRSKATREPSLDLYSTPPNSLLSKSFLQAAGSETVEAVYAGKTSPRNQIMNQADYLYYSGHGLHIDGYLDDYPPSDFARYWTNDLECVIISGCSILDINDYNDNYSYNTQEHEASPGRMWAEVGPRIMLGYNFEAPLDKSGGPAKIMRKWLMLRDVNGDPDAWMRANDNRYGRNACAISRLDDNMVVYKFYTRIKGYLLNKYELTTSIEEVPR